MLRPARVLVPAPEAAQRSHQEICAAVDALHITTSAWHGAGKPRFRGDLHQMSAEHWLELQQAGEGLLAVMDELFRLLRREPKWLESYFSMPPSWIDMSLGGPDWWNLFARLDVFPTVDGRWQICEINSDTPSGQTDMWALLQVFGETNEWGVVPGGDYEARFMALLRSLTPSMSHGASNRPVLALIYPTDISEDLDLVAAYRRQGESAGFDVVLGGPSNLQRLTDGSIGLFGQKIDVMLRHYKTDWWGERRRSWYNASFIWDAAPLEMLGPVLEADAAGSLVVVNPFGVMPTQSKKAFAFLWDHCDRFSDEAQRVIHAHVPRTRRFSDCDHATLIREQARWVLKSDFGCEGEEVIVGRNVSEERWRLSLKLAIEERWVVQEFFEIQPIEDGSLPNIGLYTVAGKSAGIYTRVNPPQQITDGRAQVLPVVIASGAPSL